MILLPERVSVLPYADAIAALGFGFSVVEPPRKVDDIETRASLVAMLRDWGWAGAEAERPSWY